jgi:hypothetical protein
MSTFALQLKAFADKTKVRADEFVGLVQIKIAERLDGRSPVGDASYWKSKPPPGYAGGRFRGNWQYGDGFIPQGETGRIDPSGSATISAVISAIPKEAAGRIGYYANNVPYAQRIEEGWSRQAPTGLVALTAMEFRAIVGESVAAVKS